MSLGNKSIRLSLVSAQEPSKDGWLRGTLGHAAEVLVGQLQGGRCTVQQRRFRWVSCTAPTPTPDKCRASSDHRNRRFPQMALHEFDTSVKIKHASKKLLQPTAFHSCWKFVVRQHIKASASNIRRTTDRVPHHHQREPYGGLKTVAVLEKFTTRLFRFCGLSSWSLTSAPKGRRGLCIPDQHTHTCVVLLDEAINHRLVDVL